ncbi:MULTISPECIES: HDOD domain-containing protein [unclassified Variovorax]|nr:MULTISPECIES: HDOD domain-containing protein [unclassified Variovorax]VTU43091.1 HDOD domain protein [Variovorax sp. SRS16]VTU43122.1 HDOD domain protein [Variovorax sp. PBL-E5]VTU43455.1 HDOD domain protein [Variovorax sp. PBL-H6]
MTKLTKARFFETLWARMQQQGDFPTLQVSLDNLLPALGADANVGTLAESVLTDFSLAQKVIRLANSAMYAPFGGGVTTVSRAIMVLGVDAVGHLALGLQLLDNFAGAAARRPDTAQELERAILAGEFARTLSASQGINQGEELVVCTLMHHLSRLLLVFYYPEEWARIQAMSGGVSESESMACHHVLGVTLEEIARAAAQKWRMPPLITATMTQNATDAETVSRSHTNWLGAMAEVSAQAAALVTRGGDADEVAELLGRHAEALGLQEQAVEAARLKVENLREARHEDEAAAEVERRHAPGKPLDAHCRLLRNLKEVQAAATDHPVSELVPLVIESTMGAMNFTHCFLMLLNPQAKRFSARIGFGPGMRERLACLSFEEGFVPDVFHFATTAQRPTHLEDSQRPEIAHRVPRWYREAFPDTKSLVLVPVFIKNRCVAVVCGDWGSAACGIPFTGEELATLYDLVGEIGRGFQRSQQPA